MDETSYDITSPQSLLEFARLLKGKSLRQLHPEAVLYSEGKGGVGQTVEKYHFGYEPNDKSEPDFVDAGVELKCTPLKKIKDGSMVSKERLGLNIINYIEEYNKKRIADAKRVAKERKLDLSLFAPEDSKGNKHPLGVFEFEGIAAEFKTLGAKKYALKRPDGTIELTVAGVNKKAGAAYLAAHGGLEAFENGFYFPPEAAKSMIVQYPDYQIPWTLTDYQGRSYRTTEDDRYGVYMEPRGYTISILPYYLEFSNMRSTIFRRGVIYDE